MDDFLSHSPQILPNIPFSLLGLIPILLFFSSVFLPFSPSSHLKLEGPPFFPLSLVSEGVEEALGFVSNSATSSGVWEWRSQKRSNIYWVCSTFRKSEHLGINRTGLKLVSMLKSVPQCSHQKNEDNNSSSHRELLYGLNKVLFVQCLVQNTHLANNAY